MSVRKGILGLVATVSLAASFTGLLQGWALEMPPSLKSLENPKPASSVPKTTTPAVKPAAQTPAATKAPAAKLDSQSTPAAAKAPATGKTTAAAKTPASQKPAQQNVYQGKATKEVYSEQAESTPVSASHVDILRSVPLEVKEYDSVLERYSTASQVVSTIDSTPNLLVHMEAIRRGYHQLSADEKDKLLGTLFARQRASEHDLMHAFNHGYAQLVFKQNKTGLFFLRKANDRFKTQFSALAYGMAQVEADINLENARPEEMTTRKMDAMYKLADAVQADSLNHQPGFWPSYVRVVEQMKSMPAYGSFVRRDFSLVYLPHGNNVLPMRGASTVSIPLKTDTSTLPVYGTSCDPNQAMDADEGGAAVSQKTVNFGTGSALIQFFNTEEPGLYRVRVTSEDGHHLLSFHTHNKASIVEDLEGDGNFEIVARQYMHNPLTPVLVYRHTPCGFELDKKVFNNFQ